MSEMTPGCCTCCGGAGADLACDGACWDCQGTGHAHNWDGMVLVIGVGCMTEERAAAYAAEMGVVPTRWILGGPKREPIQRAGGEDWHFDVRVRLPGD